MMRRLTIVVAVLALAACGDKGAGKGATGKPTPNGGADAGASARAKADAGPTLDELRIAAIQKAVNDTRAARHACWAKASADKIVAGKVVLKLRFKKTRVASVGVVSDTTRSEKLGDCLMALYKNYGWQPVFTDDTPVQLPFEFLAARAQYTVNENDVTQRVLAKTNLKVRALLHKGNTRNGAAALSKLVITGGLDIPMHKHTSAEILYFAGGTGVLRWPGGKRTVKSGTLVYIPAGAPHGFKQTGREETLAMQVYVPGGPEQRFLGGPKTGTTPVGKLRHWRGPRPIVLPNKRLKSYKLGGGKAGSVTLRLDGVKKKRASFQVMLLKPKAAVPKHKHATSSEIIYMTSGAGVVTIAGSEYPVKAGAAIQIPAGVEHAFRVTSAEPVVAMQLYVPAGPEQRFKKSK